MRGTSSADTVNPCRSDAAAAVARGDYSSDSTHGSAVRHAPESIPDTIIRPSEHWFDLRLAEFWRERHLLYFLVWRDIKIRYKQTLLGAAWAMIQPLMMMFVFTVFLSHHVSSGSAPYPLFVFAGLLPWQLFSGGMSRAGNSIVGAERLIAKVYFCRLIIPVAAIGPAFVDFVVGLGVLFGLMAYYSVAPSWTMLLAPLPVLLLLVAAMSVGSLLATLNVWFRDVRYVMPFLLQFLMFATPTIYKESGPAGHAPGAGPLTLQVRQAAESPADVDLRFDHHQPGRLERTLMAVNPVTGVIAFFRATMLGHELPWKMLTPSAATILSLFLFSIFHFRRVEDSFADII